VCRLQRMDLAGIKLTRLKGDTWAYKKVNIHMYIYTMYKIYIYTYTYNRINIYVCMYVCLYFNILCFSFSLSVSLQVCHDLIGRMKL